jgi:hypothetical protein
MRDPDGLSVQHAQNLKLANISPPQEGQYCQVVVGKERWWMFEILCSVWTETTYWWNNGVLVFP